MFVDGSSFYTVHGGLRRAGWAVVCINDDGSFIVRDVWSCPLGLVAESELT